MSEDGFFPPHNPFTTPAPQDEVPLSALPPNVTVLTCTTSTDTFAAEQTFYIVGTLHISSKSCDEVRQTIRAVKPQVVFLELCRDRRGMLQTQPLKHLSVGQALQEWRAGRADIFTILYVWLLEKLGDAVGSQPGEEFRVAVKEASEIGAMVTLGDRPVAITLARTWAALTVWEKLKIIGGLLFGNLLPCPEDIAKDLEDMKDSVSDFAGLAELTKEFPNIQRPLVAERDEWMVYAMRSLKSRPKKVVAVVGAGHVPGIRQKWDADINIQELSSVPDKRPAVWRRHLLISLAAGGLIVTTAIFVRRRALS